MSTGRTLTLPPPVAPAVDPSAVETSRLMAVRSQPDPRRMAIAAGAVVAALVGGFAAGRSTASGAEPQPAPIKVIEVEAAHEEAATAAVTEPEPEPEAEPEPPTEAEPEPAPAAPVATLTAAGTEACSVAVRSTPGSAAVLAGGELIGRTPLEAELPCGKTTLTVRRAHYVDETRRVTLAPGATAHIDARLERPEYKLRVKTTPHALVYMDGVAIGFSPVTTSVPGFTPVELTFERNGYQTGSATVEVTEPLRSIDVSLLPES